MFVAERGRIAWRPELSELGTLTLVRTYMLREINTSFKKSKMASEEATIVRTLESGTDYEWVVGIWDEDGAVL